MRALIDINSYLYEDIKELLLDMRSHVINSGEQYTVKHYPKRLHVGWECSSHWYGIRLGKLKLTAFSQSDDLYHLVNNIDGVADMINNLGSTDPAIKELDRLVKLRLFV